jgi:hypothetical protein
MEVSIAVCSPMLTIFGQVFDEVKKENFSLKLRIYFLEERMEKMSPSGISDALKEVQPATDSCQGTACNDQHHF